MSNIKVCVVGDVALDIRRTGASTRTSPEDPTCKVLSNLTTTYELGMAGNVAAWLAVQEECQVTLCGLVGRDNEGYQITDLCANLRIADSFPPIWAKHPQSGCYKTTVKERICHVEGQRIHQLIRCDRDMQNELTEYDCKQMVKQLGDADLVVVADYGKGVFRGEHGGSLLRWIGEVATRNATVIVNSKFPNPWQDYPVNALICNEKESLTALVERGGATALRTAHYIVTAGDKGVFLYSIGEIERFHSHCSWPVDVTGAGDAFMAGFALAYHRLGDEFKAESIGYAIEVGQDWAARCCMSIGCGAPTRAKD